VVTSVDDAEGGIDAAGELVLTEGLPAMRRQRTRQASATAPSKPRDKAEAAESKASQAALAGESVLLLIPSPTPPAAISDFGGGGPACTLEIFSCEPTKAPPRPVPREENES